MAQSNIILYGDVIGNSGSNTVYSITGISPTSTVPVSAATLQWLNTTASPILGQFTNAYTAGQNLTVQAQGSSFTAANGGNLVLASGTTSSGTVGNIQLQLGNTTGLTLLATGTLQFGAAVTAGITQSSAAGTGTNLNITAQSAGGTANNGGTLLLTSGASTTTGTSGNVTFNTSAPGYGGTISNILFQISGVTQAFVTGLTTNSGLGIGSTPGTSPTITSGSGTPSTTQTSGSIYLNTSGGLYTRQSSIWSQFGASNISQLTAPISQLVNTNTSHAIYTVDSIGSYDGVILHNYTASTTGYTYVMPAPTAGRQIVIRDITGSIETANTGGYITGTGTGSKVIFIAPHGTESFNGNSGFTLSGGSTFNVTNGSATVTATGSSFTTQLAPGMSITFSAQSSTSYIISAIGSNTSLTLATNYTGTTSTTSAATMNSLAYYANYGTITLYSDGTNWLASSNKPLRAYLTGSSGAFFISPGITNTFITAAGGGGGGGGGTTTCGGGGGGGSIQSTTNITVAANTSYTVAIGAGGAAGATGAAGGAGGTTSFGTLAYFYGASGGGFNSTATTYACGGYPFTNNGSTNVYSSVAYAGTGTNSINASTGITSSNLLGQLSMGGSGAYTGVTSFAGLANAVGNGSYTGGAAGGTFGGGGGGAGPQGAGAAGGASGAGGSSANANTGAGGGGGGGNASTTGGTGGSGYLYLLMYM